MRRRRPIGSTAAHVLAFDRDGAAVGLDQPVGEPQQRGLARAGAADDGQEFALGDLERDVVDRPRARARPPSKLLPTCAKAIRGGVGIHCAWTITPPPGEASQTSTMHVAAHRLNCPARAAKRIVQQDFGGNAAGGCTAKPTAVALDDATVAFRLADARVYTAVEKARLSVEHGEFVAIVGPDRLRKIDAAQRRRRAAEAGRRERSRSSTSRLRASTGRPAICFRPTRCFPGRPRSTMSRSGWRSRARRAARRCNARRAG